MPADIPDLGIKPLPVDPCEMNRKQDLPPAGGYKPVRWKRVPCKTILTGPMVIAGYIGVTAVSMYLYSITAKQIKKHEIELRSCKMAIYPILLAERDRAYLKQIYANRTEEKKLMEDIEGWEIGQLFSERVYHLPPKEEFIEPTFHSYYVHCDPHNWFKRSYLKMRS